VPQLGLSELKNGTDTHDTLMESKPLLRVCLRV